MDDYNVGGDAVAVMMAALLVGLLIIGPIIYAITSFFMMKVFEKAGVEGKWRAWVPVYNMLVFAKLGDLSPWVVLGAIGLSFIPYLNTITGLALAVLLAMAAWRIGLKLQKEAAWVVLYVLLGIVWLGINAFDKSRWNPNIGPAAWANVDFLVDKTVWSGIPVQPQAAAAPQAYGAPQGYAPPQQGYAPPQQGYAPPQQPGYPQPPAQPGYGQQPPAYGAPAPQTPGAPVPPPAAPPAAPVPPTAPPAAPPAPGTDPTQPPA